MTQKREHLGRFLFREVGTGRPAGEHPDDESLAALLEAPALEQADPEVVAHLATCDTCRGEWLHMRADLHGIARTVTLTDVPWKLERAASGAGPAADEGRSRSPRTYRWLLSAAAALGLAGVALLVPWDRPSTADPLRSQPGEVSARPLAPIGEVRAGEIVEFRWAAASGATAYEVVVADSTTGDTVLRVRATEPRLRLTEDAAARLAPGRAYRWLVRVERGVGRTHTGPPADLRILPPP